MRTMSRTIATIAGFVLAIVAISIASPSPTAHAAPGESPGGDWTGLAVGGQHVCALSAKGEVRCWGSGSFGQLGSGTADDIGDEPGEMGAMLSPVDLGADRTATAIAAGVDHTCAILDDGALKCWGLNSFGQLGLGTNTTRIGDGLGEMGDDLPAVELGTGRTAVAVTAGPRHTCALLDDATIKCWGEGIFGKLGRPVAGLIGDQPGEMGDALPTVPLGTDRTATAVSAGSNHNCALLDGGEVKCWGFNVAGQLGQGDNEHRGDDAGELGDNLPALDLGAGRTVTAISAGAIHNCAILDTGRSKCWGAGGVGQLGTGSPTNRGDGPGEMGDNLPLIALGGGRTTVSMALSGSHSCARLDDDTVKCWGANFDGQLLLGDVLSRGASALDMGNALPAADFGGGRFPTAVSTGGSTVCAVLDDNSLRCWGWNSRGQLGRGDQESHGNDPGEDGASLAAIDLGTDVLVDPAGVETFVPARLVETRADRPTVDGQQQGIGRRTAQQVTEVQVTGRAGIDDKVEAAVVNIGIVDPAANGFAVGYPCDQPRPAASTINFQAGQTIANAATVKLSATGTLCVYVHRATDLILDVTGVVPYGSTVEAITPARFFESRAGENTTDGEQEGVGRRQAGQETVIEVGGRNGVPADAEAATINVAAVVPDDNGFIAAYACGSPRPTASMINYRAGQTIAGGATIELATDGTICVFTQRAMHLVVDVAAFTPAGAIVDPNVPARLLETRDADTVDGQQANVGRRIAQQVTEVQVVGRAGATGAATAGVFSIAVIAPSDQGFAVAYPCDEPRPESSNLNFQAGQTIANNATIKLSAEGTICVYVHRATDLIVDLTATIR